MIKYRYLWLFIFGYAIGAENQRNNLINLGIASSNSSKVMPDNIFEEKLNTLKKITGYEDIELNDIYWNSILDYNELLPNSNKAHSASLKEVIIDNVKQLSNVKNNKKQKKLSDHQSNSNNNIIITQSLQNQINKNTSNNNVNNSKKTSNTKKNSNNNNNKKKKKKKKKINLISDYQYMDAVIEDNKIKRENSFVENGNKIIGGYALYEKNVQNSEFSITEMRMLIEYFNVVTDFLQNDVSTEKEIRTREELISVCKKIGKKLLDIGFFSDSIEKKIDFNTSNSEENSGGESKGKNYIAQEELERIFLATAITKESLLNIRLIVGLRLKDLLNK